MPFHFPGKPKRFQEYLNGIFERKDCIEVERLDILRCCSSTTIFQNNKLRALLAGMFPPVTVGPLAGRSVPVTCEGDTFPQFSQNEKVSLRDVHTISEVGHGKWETASTFKMSTIFLQVQRPFSFLGSFKLKKALFLSVINRRFLFSRHKAL